MKMLITGASLLAALAMPATADNRHDRKLEQAAIDIAIGKLGNLRGGFAYDAETASLLLPDFGSTASIPAKPVETVKASGWNEGLAPAREKRVVRIVF